MMMKSSKDANADENFLPGLLAFVIIAPLGFEFFRLFPVIGSFFSDLLRNIGIMS